MPDYLVHTVRKNTGVHFFYRVKAGEKDGAFSKLQKRGAIDPGEDHYETILIPKEGEEYELIAIIKEQEPGNLFELR